MVKLLVCECLPESLCSVVDLDLELRGGVCVCVWEGGDCLCGCSQKPFSGGVIKNVFYQR